MVTAPTPDLLIDCYYAMESGRRWWPANFSDCHEWVDFWTNQTGARLHYLPTVFLDHDLPVLIIGITNFSPDHRTAEIHMCARRSYNPVALMRSVHGYLHLLGVWGDVLVLYGIVVQHNTKAVRALRMLGFLPFAETESMWYSAKLLTGADHGKITKHQRAGPDAGPRISRG